jgi:hypothetical protein
MRLLNILAHNTFVPYRESHNVKKSNHLAFKLQVIKELSEAHRKASEPPHPGRPSKTPNTSQVASKTFCQKDTSLSEEGQTHEEICSLLRDKWEKKIIIILE